MSTIDNLKSQLTGGGASANQFRVTMNTPGAIATFGCKELQFYVKSAALPGQNYG